MSRLALSLLAFLLAGAPAHAHTGIGDACSFAQGFAHPVGGIDHVLVMFAIGLLAARLGGNALWGVPLSFLGMIAIGGAVGMAGVGLPLVELGIALSVIVLGLALAASPGLPLIAAMVLAGFFALFHGHAHGAGMPDMVSAWGYGLGLLLATASLHAAGIGLGLTIGKAEAALRYRALQATGSAIALAGIALFASW
jgi:urease accessory protein